MRRTSVELAGMLARGRRGDLETRVFGGQRVIRGTEVDTLYLMKKNGNAPASSGCMLTAARRISSTPLHQSFVPALRENGWDVTACEKPGATHEWGFWDGQIKAFIDFIYAEEESP